MPVAGQMRMWNRRAQGRRDIGDYFIVVSVRNKEGPVVTLLQGGHFTGGWTPEYISLCSDLIQE
jgi:hypothetical protein